MKLFVFNPKVLLNSYLLKVIDVDFYSFLDLLGDYDTPQTDSSILSNTISDNLLDVDFISEPSLINRVDDSIIPCSSSNTLSSEIWNDNLVPINNSAAPINTLHQDDPTISDLPNKGQEEIEFNITDDIMNLDPISSGNSAWSSQEDLRKLDNSTFVSPPLSSNSENIIGDSSYAYSLILYCKLRIIISARW